MADLRTHPRFRCEAAVQIEANNNIAKWGTVSDISKSGCYVETAAPLAVGKELVLVLHAFDLALNLNARVRVVHPMLGMGVEFTANSPKDNKGLEALLKQLAERSTAEQSQPKAAPPMSPALHISPDKAVTLLKEIEKHLRQHRILSREELLGMLKGMAQKQLVR